MAESNSLSNAKINLKNTFRHESPYFVFSKALNNSISNESIRSYIKNKAVSGVYGHPTIIYAEAKHDLIDGISFAEHLWFALNEEEVGLDFFENEIIDLEPYLAISIFEGKFNSSDYNPNGWDICNQAKVAWAITDTFCHFEVYDSTMNSTLISINDEDFIDEKLYVVHKFEGLLIINPSTGYIYGTDFNIENYLKNMRILDPDVNYDCDEILATLNGLLSNPITIKIVLDGQNNLAILFHDLIKYFKENCLPDPGSAGGDCGVSGNSCDRDTRVKRENIFRIQIPSKNDFKRLKLYKTGLFDYDFLFHIVSITPDINGNLVMLDKFITIDSKYLKDSNKKTINLKFEQWCLNSYQNRMKYRIISKSHRTEGSSNTVTGTIALENGGSAGFTINKTFSDADCGEDAVYYCDYANGVGSEYNTGAIKLWIMESY